MPRTTESRVTDRGSIASRDHIPALDGLRGIAILLVIPHNADVFSPHPAAWLWPMAIFAHAGWIGVQLFFVLSGFLITRNLLDTHGSGGYLKSFYGRRVLRIFPLYYLTLFFFLILLPRALASGPGTLTNHFNQVWLWTFTTNWVQPFGVVVNGFSHFWSLAVEEQFYLLWPFVVLLATGTRLFWICLAIALVALLSRVFLVVAGARPEVLYMFTNCRMDALALGAAVAALSRVPAWTDWLTEHRRRLLALILAVLLADGLYTRAYTIYDPRTLTIGHTLLACAFALLIAAIGTIPPRSPGYALRRLCEAHWLRTVGRYSFAMYVFHLPIIVTLGPLIKAGLGFTGSALPLAYALAIIGLSFVAGLLSYHLIEKHFLRLKGRLASTPAGGPQVITP